MASGYASADMPEMGVPNPVPTAMWMWADAGLIPGLARLNPDRWSSEASIEETISDLQSYATTTTVDVEVRPVLVHAWDGWGSKVVQEYPSIDAAMADLRSFIAASAMWQSEQGQSFTAPGKGSASDSLSYLATQSMSQVQWMWGDCNPLAAMNPSRWSPSQSVEDAIEDLSEYLDTKDASRSVKFQLYAGRSNTSGTSASSMAASVPEAILAFKAILAEQDARGDAAGTSSAADTFLPGLAGGVVAAAMGIRGPYTAALTAFARQHADLGWLAAHTAARRVAAVPFDMEHEQRNAGRGAHPAVQTTWEEYFASDAKQYADAFLENAHKLPDQRPRTITTMLGTRKDTWTLMESQARANEQYWCVYSTDGGKRCILVFIGGDGSTEGNKAAPGSPGRRVVEKDYDRPDDSVPLGLVRSLCDRVDREIVVIGYSNGCIPQLTIAAVLGHAPQLCRFIQYNPAMLFVPEWLLPRMASDWWVKAPAFSLKMETWAILDDPLGSGIPERSGWRLPRSPGTTHFLLAKAGFPWVANHSMSHFIIPREE